MKKYILIMSIMLMAFLALPVFAQQDESGSTSSATTDTEVVVSQEAAQDEIVTEEDLGAKTPGRFNFIKRFTRSIQKAITTDPIKKAEFEIEAAHEQLLLAKQISEKNPDDPKSAAKIEKALEKFESNIEKVKNRAQDIKESNANGSEKFLEKIADMQIKQQKMLDNLKEKLPEQAFEKVQQARERALEHAAVVFTTVAQNKEQITERINAAMEKQKGSEFKDFKNMEIMERLREHMPDEAKAAVEQAQEQARQRFEEKLKESQDTGKEQNEKFEKYMQNIKGDAAGQLKILEEITQGANVSREFNAQIEQIKTRAMEQVKKQQQTREQQMEDRSTEALFKEPAREGHGGENPETFACTMEYDPVCGVDGKTYSNACNAEKQARVKISYKGECKTELKEPINTGQVQPGGQTPENNTPKSPTNIPPGDLGGYGKLDPEETGPSGPPAGSPTNPANPTR